MLFEQNNRSWQSRVHCPVRKNFLSQIVDQFNEDYDRTNISTLFWRWWINNDGLSNMKNSLSIAWGQLKSQIKNELLDCKILVDAEGGEEKNTHTHKSLTKNGRKFVKPQ